VRFVNVLYETGPTLPFVGEGCKDPFAHGSRFYLARVESLIHHADNLAREIDSVLDGAVGKPCA
jgi:hypothetical protein